MFSKTHVLLRRELLPHLSALAPSEAKIYIAILIMACPRNGRLTIPLKDLANRTGLSYRITNHAVLRLKEMNHIRYSTDYSMKESHLEIVNYLPIESILRQGSSSEPYQGTDSQSPNGTTSEPSEGSSSQQHKEKIDAESHPPNSERQKLPNATRISPEMARKPIPLKPGEKIQPGRDPGKALILQSPADLVKNKLIEAVNREIAAGQSYDMIRSLCTTRSIPVIQKALESVQKIPPEKIKKSKLALFIYFLQHHAEDR